MRKRQDATTELGALLREKRTIEGWSLRDAAGRIGVEHSTLSDLERGNRRPEFETLVGIAVAYDVPIEELVRIAARDAGIALPAEPRPYRDLSDRLAARSVAFPDLATILDRLAGANPEAYRAFLLILDLWDQQRGQSR